MRLIRFQDLAEAPVYINPAQVAFVRRAVISSVEGPVGEFTEVGTTGGIISVKQTVAEVVKKLRS